MEVNDQEFAMTRTFVCWTGVSEQFGTWIPVYRLVQGKGAVLRIAVEPCSSLPHGLDELATPNKPQIWRSEIDLGITVGNSIALDAPPPHPDSQVTQADLNRGLVKPVW